MAKKPLSANKIIRGYSQTIWKFADLKSLGITASHYVYSGSVNRFINLNRQGFDFLGLKFQGEEGFSTEFRIDRSRYCGVIPLKSAESGKTVGDCSVYGAYGEDIAEIVSAIGDNATIEFNPNLILAGTSSLTPPIYLECLRYIDLFIKAAKTKWTKFEVVVKDENRVRGITDWNRYVSHSIANPRDALVFRNKFNSLTTEHPEWVNLITILKHAIKIVTAPNVPANAKLKVASKLQHLHRFLHGVNELSATAPIIHASDPHAIKRLKESGLLILNSKSAWKCAWRVDQAKLFEEYVQHVSELALRGVGATLIRNPHINISGFRSPWSLSHLEPDAVVRIGDTTCIIDAKYKSHMYNSNAGDGSELNENFRHDLHQILAYSSFAPAIDSTHRRCAFLVYPNSQFQVYQQRFHSDILHQTDVTLYLVGLPFSSVAINDNAQQLQDLFRILL